MGVCLVAYAVSDANIDEVLADPPLIWRIVDFEDDSAYLNELAAAAKQSLWEKLLGKKTRAHAPRTLSFSAPELRLVDLDKSWDGLNACLSACLNAHPDPLTPLAPNFFAGSGQVGRIEVGYGPALYHKSAAMARIAQAYLALGESDLVKVFGTIDLDGVYPEGLWEKRDAAALAYLLENFAALQAFVRHTAAHSLGAIIQFT